MKNLYLLFFVLCISYDAHAQVTVSGKVTERGGPTLPGVGVVVKGTTNATSTDGNGNYSITVPGDNAVLIFSFVGFTSREINVNGQRSINVVLDPDMQSLSEVVVVGYGTTTKKDLVSSVSTIKSDALKNQPVTNLEQVLQGKAAGLEVTSNSGTPGSGATIRIRGNNSINGNNDPLYVLDGFIAGSGFDINTLNPNDIESIQVLKDATALSIYGTRGASGVILITTKNGSGLAKGKPRINFNHYTSFQTTANRIELLTGQEYVDYVNESARFAPGPDGFGRTDTSLPLAYDGDIQTTDWLDLISQTGMINNTDLSIGGRTDNTNYFVSFNHLDQKGIVRASGFRKGGIRANLDVNASDRLKTGIRLNAAQYKMENNKVSYTGIVNAVVPIRNIYDANGNFTGQNPISSTNQRNPEADVQLRVDHDLVTKLTTNAYMEYEFFDRFKFKTTLGADLTYRKVNNYLPGVLPEIITGGFASINTNFARNILNENTINYDFKVGKHAVKVLGGFTMQKDNNESTRAQADGFSNDAVLFNNLALGDASTAQVESGYGQRTLISYLSRIDYNYQSKYLLTLVGRYDGSSVFEPDNKYSFFPSVGVAWNVDQEDFMKPLNTISTLKLRGSFGKVGEQGVAAYNSIATYANTTTTFNENLVNGILVGAVPSDGLTWETTKQVDLGLEVGLLRDRLSFEVDYYNKTTSDLLLRVALSGQVGANSTTQLQNLGSVRNRGLEFSFNSQNIARSNFSWRTSLTLTGNRSKILALDERPFIELQSTGNQGGNSARLVVGQPLPVFVGAQYLGTYKTREQIIEDKRVGTSFLGSPRFEDLNGDGVINNQDAQIIGSPQPDFYGGLRNTFTYKRLSLDVFVHGQYGADIFNIRAQSAFYGREDQNLDPRLTGRWIEGVNETSDIPRAGTTAGYFNPNSTVNIEDGSYLRLKSVSLSYDLPIQNSRMAKTFSNLNVYATGTNLLLLSSFKLGDPEVNNFAGGSGFNSVSQGFAGGQYPYAKSFTMGLNVQF